MSKARLVITAVTVEKRPVSEVAGSYGVARSWVYALLATLSIRPRAIIDSGWGRCEVGSGASIVPA